MPRRSFKVSVSGPKYRPPSRRLGCSTYADRIPQLRQGRSHVGLHLQLVNQLSEPSSGRTQGDPRRIMRSASWRLCRGSRRRASTLPTRWRRASTWTAAWRERARGLLDDVDHVVGVDEVDVQAEDHLVVDVDRDRSWKYSSTGAFLICSLRWCTVSARAKLSNVHQLSHRADLLRLSRRIHRRAACECSPVMVA